VIGWIGAAAKRIPSWAVDVAIAVVLGGAIWTAIDLATEPTSQEPDSWAYALGLSIAALSLFRRLWPLPVLLVSFALLQTYYLANYPGISAALPLSAALATAVAEGHRVWAYAIVGFYTVVPLFFRLVIDPTDPLVVFGDALSDAVLFGAVIVLGEAVRTRRALAEEHRLLQAERERSESLLRNVLPDPIAARLKETTDPIAEAHADVTVLFADIAGFTELSQGMDAGEVVEILDDLFTRFDALASERDLEKIKTIGDAYMVAAGVPVARPDHAEAVADMALAMLDEVACADGPNGAKVGIRIGIDTGPVVAGVIGREKFAYDLWGDTVNTASRMESSGVTGSIQVTKTVAERLGDRFAFESRGLTPVKGKGEMETFFLRGRRSPAT
jgi:class 3 adenylate cyclase